MVCNRDWLGKLMGCLLVGCSLVGRALREIGFLMMKRLHQLFLDLPADLALPGVWRNKAIVYSKLWHES